MTDKEQIIINCVDVSECEYLTYQLEEDGKYYWFCNIAPAGGPDECECNPECFYKRVLKQLARKTQECESLKQEIEILQNNFDTATRDCNEEIARLEQECEELKDYARRQENQREEYYKEYLKLSLQQPKDNNKSTLELLENKHAECEALQSKMHDLRQLREFDREARVRFYNQVCEYRKALEEIEKIASNPIYKRQDILDIINKAKGVS